MHGLAQRERNDPRQYDDLADEWWKPRGQFAMLHWIAKARADLIPDPPDATPNKPALLIDLGCGGGLLAPHIATRGYKHIGVDLMESSLQHAAGHGLLPVRSDVAALAFVDNCADVVVAGEILEHVTNVDAVVDEICRILRPGGTVIIDTIAQTWLARFVAITLAESIPGAAPKGIHDPALLVDRKRLVTRFREHGITLHLRGLRPEVVSTIAWLTHRRTHARMKPSRFTSVLFQGWGTKP